MEDRTFMYSTEEVYNSVIDGTIQNCLHLQNSRVLEELKMLWKESLYERLKSAEKNGKPPSSNFSNQIPSENQSSKHSKVNNSNSEEANPTSHHNSEHVKDKKLVNINAIRRDTDPEYSEEDEFLDAEVDISIAEKDNANVDSNSSNDSDLSELDDIEPETRDIIVAQFERVMRPTGKKSSASNRWKIVLRHGVLQINGREILFDRMLGDFNFY